jgi:hypothetical protein
MRRRRSKAPLADLTAQREILSLVAEALSNCDIAERLVITEEVGCQARRRIRGRARGGGVGRDRSGSLCG